MLLKFESIENILPIDGKVNYYGKIYSDKISMKLFDKLISEINLENDEVIVFGKKYRMNRKTAWFSSDNKTYKYSNAIKISQNWTPTLIEIKNKIEEIVGEKFNACLINYYSDGNDGMGWHADNEKEIIENSSIASFSLGEQRTFKIRHTNSKMTKTIQLENGSLLLMKDETQKYWQHCITKSKKIHNPRINLTFRKIY